MSAGAGLARDRPGTGYLVGLIGEGIAASLTPALHEAEAAHLGVDYEYRILDLLALRREPRELATLLGELAAQDFTAVNVTHPCKQLAVDVVDELDEDARRLGAVNLIVFRGGRMIGHNTDWVGYRDGFVEGLPGASLHHVVQIGCGGAGAATAYALLSCGTAEMQLLDVDPGRATALAAKLRSLFPGAVIRHAPMTDRDIVLAGATGVVHATPVGMAHHPGVAFDVGILQDGTWVSDVVYRPLQTPLLREASRRGLPILDGGRMAVGQASASIEIITGRRSDRDRMTQHFRALVDAESGRSGGVDA